MNLGIWNILTLLLLTICLYSLVYISIIAALNARNQRYQKLWYAEKAMQIKLNPRISRIELREYYVMFCKRNRCSVEF